MAPLAPGLCRDLDESQLRFALRPWLTPGQEGWEEGRKALSELGLVDLQGLRREANKRLVPDKVLSSLLQTAHKEGRLAVAPPPPGSRGKAWPLPEDEAGLVALGQRILEMEKLYELVRKEWGDEPDQQKALQELLDQGVGTVSLLVEAPTESFQDGIVTGGRLAALLHEAAVLASESELEEASRRCELRNYGPEPFLTTAPHNAFLRRDGHPLHSLEEYTTLLAQAIAQESGGSVISWSRGAQWQTELSYSLGHRQKALGQVGAVAEALDPSNRDPNFLLPEELPENAWFRKLQSWASAHAGPTLHVDVHGCQDPPKHPAHAMLGLASMRQYAEALPSDSPVRALTLCRMATFAAGLESAVGAVLAAVLGLPPAKAVVMTGLEEVVNEKGEHVQTLSGAWPPEMLRLTQTQQSVSFAGVSYALQLELSRTLRYTLLKRPAAVVQLARAIRKAWLQALQADPADALEPPP